MEKSKNTTGKAIAGIAILLVGTLFLMNNFNLLELPIKQYIFSWKTLLIVIGLVVIASRQNLIGGLFLMGLGITFWLPAMFGYQFSLGQVFLPSMLVFAGVALLLNAAKKRKKPNKKHSEMHTIKVEAVEDKA